MEQFNNTTPAPDILLQTEAANAVPNTTIDTGPPTSDEIETAIKKLKNNRAPGICGIKAELLKYGGNAIVTWLLTLFTLVWERCSIPADWTLAIILPLWKGKGSKSDCTKYRGISLLSVPAKVFAHICLSRIKTLLLQKQRPQQSGFTPCRSTLDRIISLRLLAERRIEYREPLFAAYIDLKAAFDSLDRESLWNILKIIGTPQKIIDIITMLYTSTKSMVRVNGSLTEPFTISSGVRQGCVLAANLFNTATDRILYRTTQTLSFGATFSDSHEPITDLDYADDVVLLAELFDTLKDAVLIFSRESSKLGLHINWSKTMLQSLSPWLSIPQQSIIGPQTVETTNNFTYLGCTISHNNSCNDDIKRRIAIATSTMSKLSSVWRSPRLSLKTKLRLYDALIILILE